MFARTSASPGDSGAVTVSTSLGVGPIAATRRIPPLWLVATGRAATSPPIEAVKQAAARGEGGHRCYGFSFKPGSSTTGYSRPTVLLN